MTNSTPLRRTILQLRQIFFTEACTFIALSPNLPGGTQAAAHQKPAEYD
jgi:hypothetical protein